MTISEKLIATLTKAKNVQEMLEAYNKLGEHLHQVVEEERKKLIEKANQLPKINNGT